MKKIFRTALTAILLAFIGLANAQETDTTAYSSDTYSQDTSSYDDTFREQQGSDTYNNTQNETKYSNDGSVEAPDLERGWNQESGMAPVENQDTSIHNQADPVRQEGLDKNKDYHHTGDQGYQDEQPKNTGIGSEDVIAPDKEEAHRQAQEELSIATDTLQDASQRNADPDKVGKRVENMADSVSENMHEKDRARHGLED